MKKVLVIVGMMVIGILALAIAPAMAQVPEGWKAYQIRRGDYLTRIAIGLPGVNTENILWAAKGIADVNRIENPNVIKAWNYIFVPASAEILKKALETGLVILPEKQTIQEKAGKGIIPEKRAPPEGDVLGMFIQVWNSRMAKEAAIGAHIDKLTESINGLVRTEELKSQLEKAENMVKELGGMLSKVQKENEGLKGKLKKLQGVEWKNRGLFLITLLGWALFAVFLAILVEVVREEKRKRKDLEAAEKKNARMEIDRQKLEEENRTLKRDIGVYQRKLDEIKELPAREVLQEKLKKVQKRMETIRKLSPGYVFEVKGRKFEVIGGKFSDEVFDVERSFTLDEIAKVAKVEVKHIACGNSMLYTSILSHLDKCDKV